MTISSHWFEFDIDCENDHGQLDNPEFCHNVMSAVRGSLNAMGRERVAKLHDNLIDVSRGVSDELSDDYHEACNAGCLISPYRDTVVNLVAISS